MITVLCTEGLLWLNIQFIVIIIDDQVLFNLSKLNRRLIELSCSFSAGVLLAHALEDVILTHERVQYVGAIQGGQNRNKQTSINEHMACERVLHSAHADRLPCLLYVLSSGNTD